MNAHNKVETASIHGAMAAAFREIEGATKAAAGQVGQQKYKYADLGSVIAAIKPALINHGLFFTQHPQPSDAGVTVETVLHHTGGESMSLGALFVPANRNDAQAFGSALTYARRYALVTAFGVPVEDDDGSAAVRGQGKSTVSPEPSNARQSVINDAQRTELMAMLDQMNVPVAPFLEKGNISDLSELADTEFEVAKRWIAKQAKVRAEKAKPTFAEELADDIPY
jgi:hypothetical protein